MDETRDGKHPIDDLPSLLHALREFATERDWDQYHSPKNLASALSVEAGELLEHFQWLTAEESQQLPPEKLAEVEKEIADVLIYLVRISDLLGVDPLAAADRKLEENRKKYPADVVKGSADKYTAYE